ncbi:arginine--tRNA ligase [Candidatus Margulisiibacteriota bacterium]
MAKDRIATLLDAALSKLGIDAELDFKVDIPRQKQFGDFASNIAILYGKKLSRNPLDLAKEIAQTVLDLDKDKIFSKVDVAKPGFVNFTLSLSFIQQNILDIPKQDHDWGKTDKAKGQKVLLEFVSANPTGPLHVGHGRWAVIGDAIARMLKATGCQVESEFYVNNVGKQVELLFASVRATEQGKAVPEGGYGGAYIKDVADKKFKKDEQILDHLISEQKATLADLRVGFKHWYFESELHKKGRVKAAIEKLHDNRMTFEEGGAIWFKSMELGDDKNRVLIREDGQPTYFAADIAYHLDKFERGYDHLIDIWGTDHHGYVKRLKSAVKAMGQPDEKLEIIIGQLVTLYRGDEPVRMSKRTGEMVTLQEVIDEIGADATRFFFSATDVNSHLDFDLELAKEKSQKNPVYYVQYAHARICSILKKTIDQRPKTSDLSSLNHPAERDLMIKLLIWPNVVVEAARLRHPHRITEYAKELGTVFHSFYEQCRVLGDPARLFLVKATQITLRNTLELLGINAPESM